MNPFTLYGDEGSAYFCDREEETARLTSSMQNGRNVTLISIRRLGKTGLIHHSLSKLKRNFDCVYVDIMATSTLAEFTEAFGKAVLNQLEHPIVKSWNTVSGLFRKIKPVFSVDPLSGVPQLEFDLKNSVDSEITLEDIFRFLEKRKKKVVVAVDEFQQVTEYAEKKTEALLRTHIQRLKNVRFIFAGSQKHLLTSMFNDASRPFYQSTEFMLLHRIEKDAYTAFISRHFSSASKKITPLCIAEILDWAKNHTFYVQALCNKLYSLDEKNIDNKILQRVCAEILWQNEGTFINYKNLLSVQQWNLLKAIAKEDAVSRLNQKDFLNRHHLGASSVQRSIKALLDREMVVEEDGVYRVYDVFLGRWLASKF